MSIVIRPMSPSDFQPLAVWMVELPLLLRYGVTTEKAISGFEAAAERGDWLIAAEAAALPCGFAWAIPSGAFGRSPYLRLIGVRADMTGTGIGAALLDEIERMAAEVAGDLFLLVSDFNEGGQRFYARRGYTQVGAISDYVLTDVTELIFRKRLK